MENAVRKGALDSVEFLNFVEKFAFFFFVLSHSEGCLVRAVEVGLYSGRERPCMMRIWQWQWRGCSLVRHYGTWTDGA